MNTRKIKLALTAGLINKNTSSNALQAVKELMNNFADDAGRFLGLIPGRAMKLGGQSVRQSYVFRYENCTLNVDLVSHPHRQTIQRFHLS
ncbi:MAG: hypothetical protein D6772_02610 [Bacteroidetes bacterium]|nr:MAG: hypothetical protein D6772_02610 [Bacteroidota bacterium]